MFQVGENERYASRIVSQLPRARKGDERGKMSHTREGNTNRGERGAEVIKGRFPLPFTWRSLA